MMMRMKIEENSEPDKNIELKEQKNRKYNWLISKDLLGNNLLKNYNLFI